MDDKAQIMIIEAVIFAIFIVLSLIFIYIVAPSYSISNVYTDAQKIEADDALYTMSKNYSIETTYENYPLNELSNYILINDYKNFINRLDNLLDADSQYNIWISNLSDTVLWCNSSTNDYDTLSINPKALETSDSLIVATHIIAIPPIFRDNSYDLFSDDFYLEGRYYSDKSDLSNKFSNYSGSIYEIILELWET